jgi:flagellar hook-associated protein 3 FlgL
VRVTDGMIYASANQSLGRTISGLQDITEKVATTKRLNRPSDDPADVRSAVRLNDSLAELNQFLRNIDLAKSKVGAMDAALQGAGDLIQRANELAISGANGSLGSTDRQIMVEELNQMIEAMAQDANTQINGEYVFSGFKVDRQPFDITGPGTVSAYQGDHGVVIARVGAGSTMQVNMTGDAAFGGALAALTQLRDDLASGNAVQQTTIGQIQTALDTVTGMRAQIGARANRLDETRNTQEQLVVSNKALLSQLADMDMAEAITEMTKRQTTYQATLAVTAKVMQTSLIDYLR